MAQLASLGVVGNLVKDFNDRSNDDSLFNSNTNDKGIWKIIQAFNLSKSCGLFVTVFFI